MKETNPIIRSYALFGILFTFIIGCLFHFAYELTNYTSVIGYFSPVNESVWEHLKLGFYAWTLYGIVNYFFLMDQTNNYWLGIFSAGLAGNLFIVIFFYTYSGIMGHSILTLDIISFLISCIIGACVFYRVVTLPPLSHYTDIIGIILLILIGCIFALFTYQAPNLPLFHDFSIIKAFNSTSSVLKVAVY